MNVRAYNNNNLLIHSCLGRAGLQQTYGCLRLTYHQNQTDHYIAWAPQRGNLKDSEIGINGTVARAIGKRSA